MKKIVAVSAGQEFSGKGDNAIRRNIRYLNYGLLGLATILNDVLEKEITVFQANYNTPIETVELIENAGIDIENECECFLLSIPSYYSITWCQLFCKIVKQTFNKKIIVGGRWVIDNNIEWIKKKLPYVDIIIEGFGEKRICELFSSGISYPEIDGSKTTFSRLNYQLLYNYQEYQPCIEISRGCGAGCQFCADRSNKRIRNKPVNKILQEVKYIEKIYSCLPYIYFEAPHFIFEKQWTHDFYKAMSIRNKKIGWRCTTRVESVPINELKMLAETGLKVLDIGLESASFSQLVKMGKTRSPGEYLCQAEKILIESQKYGIWVKFNILLYAGETYETLNETIRWLNEYKELIKDISVSSLIYYKNMKDISKILKFGAHIPQGQKIEDLGFVNLDLSRQIDYFTAKKLCTEIPKKIANQRDFFDIKSVSYFMNGYTYNQFEKDLKLCSKEDLPFAIE